VGIANTTALACARRAAEVGRPVLLNDPVYRSGSGEDS
jgi:hypothetical protein